MADKSKTTETTESLYRLISALGILGQEYHRLDESDRVGSISLGKELTFCFEILDDMMKAEGVEISRNKSLIKLRFDRAISMSVHTCAALLLTESFERRRVFEEELNHLWRYLSIAAIGIGR